MPRVTLGQTTGTGWSDQLQVTPVIRAVAASYPGKIIDVLTFHPELFHKNPWITGQIIKAAYQCRIPGEAMLFRPLAFQHYWEEDEVKPTTAAFGWQVGLDITDTRQELHLRKGEEAIGRAFYDRVKKKGCKGYIAIQSQADPPKKIYQLEHADGRKDITERRWSGKDDWWIDRHDEVADGIKALGFSPVQIGCSLDPKIPRCGYDLRKIGLRPTAAIIKYANAVVGMDSLPMFLASAMGTHAVVLWSGRTRPAWQALEGRTHIDMTGELPCRDCWIPDDRNEPCRFGRRCMDLITPEIVLKSVEEVLHAQNAL